MESEQIKTKTIRSIIALTSRTVLLQTISFGAFFLLGIFLSPSVIGVYIVVSAIMRIFNLFTDIGLGAALIQKNEDLAVDDLKTAFTIQEILVGIIVIIGLSLSSLVGRLSHLSADGVFLYQVLIFTLFISSLKVIPSILMERKLAFERQVIPQIVEAIVFNLIVVFLAYKGFQVKSFSWAVLASSLASLPIYYLLSPWRLALGFSRVRARHLFSYGLAYQGKSFLAVIKDDLLTFFLTGIVGTSGIGYWGWAQRWAYSPYRLIVDSVTKVTFPAYSRIQADSKILKSGLERTLFGVSTLLFPILVMMMLYVPKLIYLIPRYSKWQPSIPSFYFLAGTAAVTALMNILVNVLDSTGRVKTTLGLMILWIVATWLTTILFVQKFGFTGMAISSFIVTSTIVIVIYLVKKVVNFTFLANVLPSILGIMAMTIVIFPLLKFLPNSWLILLLTGLLGAIIYLVTILIFAKDKLLDNAKTIIKAYKS